MTLEQGNEWIIDNLNTAVVMLDASLCVVFVNPAAEALLQASRQRLLETPILPLFADGEEQGALMLEALAAGHTYTQRQALLQLGRDELIPVDYSVTPLVREDAAAILLELHPIERFLRINREEQLVSANDTSKHLIRGLAHEIKNPLGGIRGAAQLLEAELQELGAANDLCEFTRVITVEVDRLRNLVDRLLGPTQPPRMAPLNIHQVTEHVSSLVTAEMGERIEIIRDYDPSIPDLVGDSEKLIQAVLNLVRNAVQAMADVANPRLIFRTRIQRNFTYGGRFYRSLCRIDIVDNGPGIPDQIAEQIFYPMVTSRPDGTGLGLTIAQTAVSLHKGLIQFETQPGETQFSIYLPFLDHQE